MIYLLLTWLCYPLLQFRAWNAERSAPSPKRILVIQMAKIGDFLCSTPVFRELRERFPSAQIDVLANPINRALIQTNPHISSLLEAEAKDFSGVSGKVRLIKRLRHGNYDTVICLNAGLAYAIAALWAGIPRRMAVVSNFPGFSLRLASQLWTTTVAHEGNRLIQLTYLKLLEALGVVDGSLKKDVFLPPGSKQKAQDIVGGVDAPLIGIGVSSANRLKALEVSVISEIIQHLFAQFDRATVVLIGGASDREKAQEVMSSVASDRIIDSCGSCSLAELPALLQRLDVFIGVDSGVTYMADAMQVPIVSVAGPCNMEETRPLGDRVTIIQPKGLSCAPCAHIFRAPYSCHTGTRACVLGVSVEEISDAARLLLKEVHRSV